MRNATSIRRPLLLIALLLALVKSAEFAIDSAATFCVDSGAFMVNALRMAVIAERSYFYGFLIRAFALPFHSLRAILVMQFLMGGISGWLLGFVLLRYFKVRPWIAILASLVFAIDPAQVMDEHMVMTEASAMLAMAVFLTIACGYLESPAPWRLVVLAFAGAVLVGMRIVFVPPVVALSVLLPLGARKTFQRPRVLAMALAVSCGATFLFQEGYRHLTGDLAGREPAYHYATGFFLVSAVAPLVDPGLAPDAVTAKAIDRQNQTEFPLKDVSFRSRQLWQSYGFVARLKEGYRGDLRQANDAANRLAHAAILRHPIGLLKLGLITYVDYWLHLRHLKASLPWEIGTTEGSKLLPLDVNLIGKNFHVDVSRNWLLQTRSRRYYLWGAAWHIFLLLAPLLAGIAWWLSASKNEIPLLFFLWSLLLLAATCLGAVESVYRYLHPFSFTGLIAAAFLLEMRCVVAGRRDSSGR
jgi:hypothetical protein